MNKARYTIDTFKPDSSIGYLIKRAHKTALELIERRFGDVDISMSQWFALALVESGIVDTTAGLARELGHDSGATTRMVDDLHNRGLIRRNRDPDDRRVARLELTHKGKRVHKHLSPRVVSFWNEALTEFTAIEIDQLIALTRRLTIRLSEMKNLDPKLTCGPVH
jgi:DNA-binding MarR family transcriptional regulator